MPVAIHNRRSFRKNQSAIDIVNQVNDNLNNEVTETAIRMLNALHKRQTPIEAETSRSIGKNEVGFSNQDSRFVSAMLNIANHGGTLTYNQAKACRLIARKYRWQYASIVLQ